MHDSLQELRALSSDARLIFYKQRDTENSDHAEASTYTAEQNVADLEIHLTRLTRRI